MSKHTPGPWHVERLITDSSYDHIDVESDGHAICSMYVPQNGNPNYEADAKLIAAAPILLAAIKGLLNGIKYPILGGFNIAIAEAENAVKIAEGVSEEQ